MKTWKKHKDSELLERLLSSKSEALSILSLLYQKHYEYLEKTLIHKGASIHDTQDFIQDAIILFYEKVKDGALSLDINIRGYLKKVVTHKLMDKNRKNKRFSNGELFDFGSLRDEATPYDILHEKEEQQFAKELMNELGASCQKILLLSIYRNHSMKEIAMEMGFQNDQIARNKKSRCLKRLRAIIKKSYFLMKKSKELRH